MQTMCTPGLFLLNGYCCRRHHFTSILFFFSNLYQSLTINGRVNKNGSKWSFTKIEVNTMSSAKFTYCPQSNHFLSTLFNSPAVGLHPSREGLLFALDNH